MRAAERYIHIRPAWSDPDAALNASEDASVNPISLISTLDVNGSKGF